MGGTWRLAAAVAALMMLAVSGLAAREGAPAAKHYSIKKTSHPLVIDGHLDEAAWRAAEPIELGGYHAGVTPLQSTTCRALWDDRFIYFAYECRDSNIWSTMTRRDQPLYDEEVVEVFLDPDRDLDTYVEIEVNPLGALWDGFILNRGVGRITGILAWNSLELRRAVALDGTVNRSGDRDGGWTVELAVPLRDLVTAPNIPPKAGDRWRINLFRIDLPDGPGSAASGDYSTWVPVTGESFHDPDCFGEIEFSGEELP